MSSMGRQKANTGRTRPLSAPYGRTGGIHLGPQITVRSGGVRILLNPPPIQGSTGLYPSKDNSFRLQKNVIGR